MPLLVSILENISALHRFNRSGSARILHLFWMYSFLFHRTDRMYSVGDIPINSRNDVLK
jgi:hypothetical protein